MLFSQYGGIDSFREFPFADCNTFDLPTRQWTQQPDCSYVDTTGPYLTWDAASVVLPNRREALLLGGRITTGEGSGVSFLVPADEHWAINLDTLSWRRLSADPMFWGLPQLSGGDCAASFCSVSVYPMCVALCDCRGQICRGSLP